ncbi:hypothetical protein [Halomonas sp. GT]|nr:hypothetical protein [Halomonas sp. GT]
MNVSEMNVVMNVVMMGLVTTSLMMTVQTVLDQTWCVLTPVKSRQLGRR